MKKFKLFAILCIVAIMIATTATIVSAASSKAYGDIYYGCTNNWNPIKDKLSLCVDARAVSGRC